jgi:diguanylate cyclase (GGDEF)-like protein
VDQPLTDSTSDNLTSPFAEQRKLGFRMLRFTDFVEEQFRQYYAESAVQRARAMPITAIAITLVAIGVMLAETDRHTVMLGFNTLFLMPLLIATLYASFNPRRHRLYQNLLAASAFMIGMWLTSIVTRASLDGMPYYFAAEIGWLFVVWLILGLPFRHAAIVSIIISGVYVFGAIRWGFNTNEIVFDALMLAGVNCIGGFCCYQLEYAVRQSFLDSHRLKQLVEKDGLTGLDNRRSYDEFIERIWRQSRREHAQLTVMLIDIDHFKAFNDHYGHQAGDDALKTVANVISQSVHRPLDLAARIGGEEFALILYGPGDDYGRELAEQLRTAVREQKINHTKSPTDQYLTISIGVAMLMPDTQRSMTGAIQMADEALYQAKEEGRNKVVFKSCPNAQLQTGRFRARESATA